MIVGPQASEKKEIWSKGTEKLLGMIRVLSYLELVQSLCVIVLFLCPPSVRFYVSLSGAAPFAASLIVYVLVA